MKSSCRLFPLGLLLSLATFVMLPAPPVSRAAPPSFRQLRIIGPAILERGGRHLIYVEGTADGRNWQAADPDHFSVRVDGAGRLREDPAALLMNPFEIACDDKDSGKVVVEVRLADKVVKRTFLLGTVKPAGSFDATINPLESLHRFTGMGAGVLFYDNQFDITPGDDLYDWCFRDVRTSILHVLIRPDYQKEEDRGDWRTLDLARLDFRSLERPIRIIKKALQRNPELKLYASLYSPPPWMKTNGSTGGQGTLKDGLQYRRQLARYLFAYLKYTQSQGLTVHYLGFFNEPDWPHTQDGMHFSDLGMMAETFADCAASLNSLIAADGSLKQRPIYVFPDTLGPGSLTRAGAGTLRLRQQPGLLQQVGVWGVHDYWNQAGTYWNNRYRELRALPGVGGRPVWMTEWAQRSRHGDLASATEYGVEILNSLRLGAEAWMAFEWCHPSGNQAGLISTDWGAKLPRTRYWRSKAYHIFRQIANTTPPGSHIVSMTGRWTGKSQARGSGVEYLALRDGAQIIVHLMNTEPAPVHYRLNIRAATQKPEGRLTTPLADFTAVNPGDLNLQSGSSVLSGQIPGNSLLTVALREGSGKD
ncbi:MAG TPA: hypothetical protein VG099_00580 [Gemmataceae bacterium]|jgi:hypothetical protein|nr:hypothetical protein [Gemmataceae bacterium]